MVDTTTEKRLSEKLCLFQELKSTVERILSQHSYDVWSVHGGLESLMFCLDAIFQHGSRPHVGILGTVVDYWLFVRGLRWLEPTLAPSIDRLSKLSAASPSKPIQSKTLNSRTTVQLTHGQQWLDRSLKDRSISRQIKVLVSDHNHVQEHYYDWAYLLDEAFTTATLTCITALEQNSSVLLANIPSSMFARRQSPCRSSVRMHTALTSTLVDVFASSDFDSSSLDTVALERGSSTLQTEHMDGLLDEEDGSDPLSASLKTSNISERKVSKIQAKRATTAIGSYKSNSSVSSLSHFDDDDDTDTVMSCQSDFTVASPTEDLTLHERLYAEKTSTSTSAINQLSRARKPLFCDSSDDENDQADDLAFLLSPTTEFTMESTNESSYYLTMESKSHLIRTAISSAQTSKQLCSPKHTEKFFQTQESSTTPLPDLVISAEVSRSNNLQSNTVTSSSNSAARSDCDLTMVDGANPGQVEISSTQKKVEVETLTALGKNELKKSTHRRCKSVQDHPAKDFYTTGNRSADDLSLDKINSSLSPSSSLSQTIPGQQPATTENHFPKSQSLMMYLKNQDLATCADIDKQQYPDVVKKDKPSTSGAQEENAHFDFSEMLIVAIEQVKCRMKDSQALPQNIHKSIDEDPTIPDDESEPDFDEAVLSVSRSYHSPVGSVVSESLDSTSGSRSGVPQDTECAVAVSPQKRTIERKSTASLSNTDSLRTAESIAIGLLQTFSGQRHATASEIDWLISEEDVPQKLLPLPKSTAIDPDTSTDQGIRIRGNQDWAPPRPQIIFKAPNKVKLKHAMTKQNNRCAGCGTYVEKAFIKRFRYCEYTGKYFCTCCHDNKLAVLPAYVLQKFDFNKGKVSNFSYDWLMKINREPLFNVIDINPSFYSKFKVMVSIRDLRLQMISLYKYLQVCRLANSPSEEFKEGFTKKVSSSFLPYFLECDPHLYSLYDLEGAKNGELLEELKVAIDEASRHVTTCELCRMKGFICEICRSNEIIFPHQTFTSTCSSCNSCFHAKCFVPDNCPKCSRLRKRREALRQISEE